MIKSRRALLLSIIGIGAVGIYQGALSSWIDEHVPQALHHLSGQVAVPN